MEIVVFQAAELHPREEIDQSKSRMLWNLNEADDYTSYTDASCIQRFHFPRNRLNY